MPTALFSDWISYFCCCCIINDFGPIFLVRVSPDGVLDAAGVSRPWVYSTNGRLLPSRPDAVDGVARCALPFCRRASAFDYEIIIFQYYILVQISRILTTILGMKLTYILTGLQ